jgi:hypothetical protein
MPDIIITGGGPAVACPSDSAGAQSIDIDPELERQLTQAAEDELVEAVLLLRQSDQPGQAWSPGPALLQRVCGSEAAQAIESTYLPRMGALIVRACPPVIRQLIAQPEVEIACANRGARSSGDKST